MSLQLLGGTSIQYWVLFQIQYWVVFQIQFILEIGDLGIWDESSSVTSCVLLVMFHSLVDNFAKTYETDQDL